MLGKNVNFMKQNDLKYYRKLKRSCSARIVFLMNTFFSNSSLYSLSSAQIDYYGS